MQDGMNLPITLCFLQRKALEYSGKITKNIFYVLKSRHPIIDFVVHVHNANDSWLVLIQISTQKYDDHKPMSDIFHRLKRCTRKMINSRTNTLYEHFCKLAESLAKVMLLYVSPREKDDQILPTLQSAIIHHPDKARLYIGILARGSSFHIKLNQSLTYLT